MIRPKDFEEVQRMRALLSDLRAELERMEEAIVVPDFPPSDSTQTVWEDAAYDRASTRGEKLGLWEARLMLERVQSGLHATLQFPGPR